MVSSMTFNIASGASASQEITLGSETLVGLQFSGWKATTGAFLQCRANSGATAGTLFDKDGAVVIKSTVQPAANDVVALPPDVMVGKRLITLCSGAPGALVAQDAARTVTIFVKTL